MVERNPVAFLDRTGVLNVKLAVRVLRLMGVAALTLLVILSALAFVLLRTQPGHDLFLRATLAQVPRFLSGEVAIGRLRSDGLLRGFTLEDVRVADAAGRPFVTADSLRVRYSISDLVRRNVVLVPVDIWSPTVVFETLHGDSASNVRRIVGSQDRDRGDPDTPRGSQQEDQGATGISLALRQTNVHDGRVLIRLPVNSTTARGVHERLNGMGEGDYRLIQIRQVEARISAADLLGAAVDGQSVRFEQLSLNGQVLEEPFTVTELKGDLVRHESSLRLDLDHLSLPDSELSGDVEVRWGSPEGAEIEANIQAEVLQFSDFLWLEPRLPSGGGRLNLRVSGPLERTAWRVPSADLSVEGSRVRGEVGFDLGGELRFTETELELTLLYVHEVTPWLPEPLPFEGVVTGTVRADGPLSALRVSTELSFEDSDRGIPPSTAVVDGTLRVSDRPGVSDLTMTVEPLRYGTLRAFLPDLELNGDGRATVRASGSLASGVQMSGGVEHYVGGGPRSAIQISGTVQRSDEDLNLALAATLADLSLDGLSEGLGRPLPVSGPVSGSIRAAGPVSNLLLSTALTTPGGAFEATTRLDLREPFRQYRVEASVDGFRLDRLASRLPDPTVVSGELLLDGEGGDPRSLNGTAALVIRDARVGRADLGMLETRLRAVEGRLLFEELSLTSPLITLSGSGDLALGGDQPDGVLSLSWAADSLSALRPVVLGEQVIAADTLTQLEREVLRLDGIDPDTLGAVGQVTLSGSARGEAVLRGGIRDLDVEGFAEITSGAFSESTISRSRADLRGSWRRSGDWMAEAVVDFDSLSVRRFAFDRGSGGVRYRSDGLGDFDLLMQGTAAETYVAEGMLERDSIGMEVVLEALEMRIEDEEWGLDAPSRVRFEGASIRSDGFRLVGPSSASRVESAPGVIEALGTLDLERDSDFELNVSQVDLDRLAAAAQVEGLPSGILDLSVRINGPAESPRIESDVLVQEFSFNGISLSDLEGTLEYRDLALRTRVTGDRDGRRLISLEGLLPANLSFADVDERFPEGAIDLTLRVDSFPASTALAFLDPLEEVQGSFDGEVQLRGTPRDLRPSGELRLSGGQMSLPGLGLRPTALNVDFRAKESLEVEVEAEARALGQARITGTLGLGNITDPEFDLQLSAAGFEAVDRRDLAAQIAGELSLTGPYSAPQINGAVSVERGELLLEEFVRGTEVIDLTDPRFFDVVDTTVVATRPISDAAPNAFLQNLRVDVELSLEQDFWLRSQESIQGMDVEIVGDLAVTFDRPARELRLAGILEAIRGSYAQFGRQFDVQSGAVEFFGTPGIDPSLSIQAIHRLRRVGAEPLNVIANVGGTLQTPAVTLSSDAQPPIAESDLISYLLFGRPAFALASGEVSAIESAATGLVNTTLSLGVSQLGSTFSRSLGVDYLSVSQAQQGGLGTFRDPTGLFADTQIEMGRYVGENVFFAVSLRPLTRFGPIRRTQLPGARLEWRFQESWSTEGFLEDRFARPGGAGFGELDNDFTRVFGVSLFREWGY